MSFKEATVVIAVLEMLIYGAQGLHIVIMMLVSNTMDPRWTGSSEDSRIAIFRAKETLNIIFFVSLLVTFLGVVCSVMLLHGVYRDKPDLLLLYIVYTVVSILLCFVNVYSIYAICFSMVQIFFIVIVWLCYVEMI